MTAKRAYFTRHFSYTILLLLTFFIPTLIWYQTSDVGVIKTVLLRLSGALLGATFLIQFAVRPPTAYLPTRLSRLICLYLLWNALTLLWALPYWRTTLFAFSNFLFYVLIYLSALHTITRRVQLRWLVDVWLMAATLVMMYAILQWFDIEFLPWRGDHPIKRVWSTFGSPNHLATYLILTLPLALWRLLQARSVPLRIGIALLMIGMILSLVFTQSRGGWVGFVAACILLALLTGWKVMRHPQTDRRRAFLMVGMVMLLVGIGAGILWMVPQFQDRIKTLVDSDFNRARVLIWQSAFNMFKAQPLWGHGYGTFVVKVPLFKPPELDQYHPFSRHLLSHAHNEFLETAAETGIIGLLLQLSVLMLLYGSAIRAYLKHPSFWRDPTLYLIVGITGVWVQNLFSVDSRFVSTATLLWLSMGITDRCAWGDDPTGEASEKPRSRKLRHHPLPGYFPLIGLISAVLVGGVGWHSIIFFRGDVALQRGQNILRQLAIATYDHPNLNKQPYLLAAQKELSRAIEIDPFRVDGYVQRGYVYLRQGDYDRAEKDYQQAEQIMPNYPGLQFNIAMLLQATGRLEEAIERLNAELTLNPNSDKHRRWLAQLLVKQRKGAAAVPILEDALAKEPENPQIQYQLMLAYEQSGDCKNALKIGNALDAEYRQNLLYWRIQIVCNHRLGRTEKRDSLIQQLRVFAPQAPIRQWLDLPQTESDSLNIPPD